MSRLKLEWRSASKDNYNDFCKKHPTIKLSQEKWRKIIYAFNTSFRDHILDTGERARLPLGLGEFSIQKKKRKKLKEINGKEYVNLAIDWPKTIVAGKHIYNFNFHTEGYFFGWRWFRETARFRLAELWYFKPCRNTSRLLSQYLKSDNKYQHLYSEWKY